MKIEQVGQALYQYFSTNRIFKVLLPLNSAAIWISIIFSILRIFFNMSGFVNTLVFYIWIIGILISFSKSNYKLLFLSFLTEFILFVCYVFRNSDLSVPFGCSPVLNSILFGYLAYYSYKKSVQLNE